MRKYQILIAVFAALHGLNVQAQIKLSGVVNDKNFQKLQGITLKLQNENRSYVEVISSDSLGNFYFSGLSSGTYELQASYIGFLADSINLRLTADTVIVMEIDTDRNIQLSEVTVTSSKPLIEKKN